MDQENILFSKKNNDKSYTMTGLYLNHNISFGHKDSYNYDDIDINKILLLKKSDWEYFIRYNDLNKKKSTSLQSKIEKCYFGKLYMFMGVTTLVMIHNGDNQFFRKCREIWNNSPSPQRFC